jgi:single-stranded-DNA-specific exonuclease
MISVSGKKWTVLNKKSTSSKKIDIVDVLLKNRGINKKKERDEFFNPTDPKKIKVADVGLSKREINKTIKRLEEAKEKKQKIVIYGDYDADGICATAILWEALYKSKFDVIPHIPDRFEEGYGINSESVEKLKKKNPKLKLIVTVDNGIVAHEAVKTANKLGIDVVITDHHRKEKKTPKSYSIIHTTEIGGAGIAWLLAREILKNQKLNYDVNNSLELAAIGTIADQIPLLGVNRSIVKFGLVALNNTKRFGLIELLGEARLKKGDLGTYEVGYMIAPRINAMGRLEHGIDSLRLLCTTNPSRAQGLAAKLGKTNRKRQKIVEEVVVHANDAVAKSDFQGVVIIAHESYHEGVIGLAASKLVEKYYRPAIVLYKGEKLSKASARSISGFSIIETLRQLEHLMEGVGGHDMAAGFTIKTDKIGSFTKKLDKITKPLLTKEVLSKRIKADLEIPFSAINKKLLNDLKNFEPTGIGNPAPSFTTSKINVLDARTVGFNGKHLKIKLEKQDYSFDAIAFGLGDHLLKLSPDKKCDIVYTPFLNIWNGYENIELKVKDIRVDN